MIISLDTQVDIYAVDTGDFYSNRELRLHNQHHKLKAERKFLKNKVKLLKKEFAKYKIEDLSAFDKCDNVSELYELCGTINPNIAEYKENFVDLIEDYLKTISLIAHKRELIKSTKEELLSLLHNKVETNILHNGTHHKRILRPESVKRISDDKETNNDKNIISVFMSTLIRTIGIEENELTDNFMVVQIYFFDILKDLIYFGFEFNGEKYVYYTSSAGQIRTKKCVFIKESILKAHEKTLMCGLTTDIINQKGGNIPNKHLSYTALTNSATDIWKEFDVDKTIVIDDFETNVLATYDFVNDETYEVERKTDFIPITHTDGAGMMLPNAFGVKQKNMMVRLPWVKGLITPFDFKKFIEVNNASPVIVDIYGVEHDIIKEDIQVIFTKSQVKMGKYYLNWKEYRDNFKKYKCQAGYTNPEEDCIKDASINYQMLQTLIDATDDEITEIAKSSLKDLNSMTNTVGGMQNALGITPYNHDMTYFQRSIEMYPELLNDEYVKNLLREIKTSMVKRFKAGKLKVKGKYTFILPDFYAACEYWFLNNSNPNGLLDDGEVFCWLFRKADKVDCLRSPHLFFEHAIRKNIAVTKEDNLERQEKIREWFDTDAVYTSCRDCISKILQFDDL